MAVSSIDGRYRQTTECLSSCFSEYALFKDRIFIEIEYFKYLSNMRLPQLPSLNNQQLHDIDYIYHNFDIEECMIIKNIEKKTKHDVKAVEYYLQQKFTEINLDKYISFIHFGLTSQDINTSSNMIGMVRALNIINKYLASLICELDKMIHKYKNIVMLSRTHGQPAVPTTVGKELNVFKYRLTKEISTLSNIKIYTKFGGAVGNCNSHKVAYPTIDWNKEFDKFVETLDLHRSQVTTQIDNYDTIASVLDCVKRINCIIIDLNVDMWLYISLKYFKQNVAKGEIGSSTMPQKVNPINFENSEGNLIIAISLLECISRKLPVSRMQRDLTDSTILRNLGSAFGHCIIGYTSTINGLKKVDVNVDVLNEDLENNYSIITEALQTILRREGLDNAYEQLKNLTLNHDKLNKNIIGDFINKLNVTDSIKQELKEINVFNYVGYSIN